MLGWAGVQNKVVCVKAYVWQYSGFSLYFKNRVRNSFWLYWQHFPLFHLICHNCSSPEVETFIILLTTDVSYYQIATLQENFIVPNHCAFQYSTMFTSSLTTTNTSLDRKPCTTPLHWGHNSSIVLEDDKRSKKKKVSFHQNCSLISHPALWNSLEINK